MVTGEQQWGTRVAEVAEEKCVTQLHAEWARRASWKEILQENSEGVEQLLVKDVKTDFQNLRRKLQA